LPHALVKIHADATGIIATRITNPLRVSCVATCASRAQCAYLCVSFTRIVICIMQFSAAEWQKVICPDAFVRSPRPLRDTFIDHRRNDRLISICRWKILLDEYILDIFIRPSRYLRAPNFARPNSSGTKRNFRYGFFWNLRQRRIHRFLFTPISFNFLSIPRSCLVRFSFYQSAFSM